MLEIITIFTDGSCLGNPGPGGYGIIIKNNKHEKILSAGYKLTTNNRMELMAVIIALKEVNYYKKIIFNTDSKYVYKGITTWIINWKKNGWLNKSNKKVKNIDLWLKLEHMFYNKKISCNWIKGHSNNKYNNKCDIIANNAAHNSPFLEDTGYILSII